MRDWAHEIRKHIAGLSLSATREAEIIEEISQHLEQRYQELALTEINDELAHQSALNELADSQFLKGQLRKVERHFDDDAAIIGARRTNMIGDLWHDIKYGLRVFAKNPGFFPCYHSRAGHRREYSDIQSRKWNFASASAVPRA